MVIKKSFILNHLKSNLRTLFRKSTTGTEELFAALMKHLLEPMMEGELVYYR